MNDNADRDRDDSAERLLLDTLRDLRDIASIAVKDESLSVWSRGRSRHGYVLLDRSSQQAIDLVKTVCAQAGRPDLFAFLLYEIASLVLGSFKIGQGSKKLIDQTEHESDQRTKPARNARRERSGKQKRIEIVSDLLAANPKIKGTVKEMLSYINPELKARGLPEAEEHDLRRDLKEIKKILTDTNDGFSISDAFRPADG